MWSLFHQTLPHHYPKRSIYHQREEPAFPKLTTPTKPHSKGGFHFAQAVLPRLLKATETSPTHPPTLIFTGATASLKASANFSSFAVSKFATRALVQSLTREFGPKGIHVAHAIIDGIIDTPGTAGYMQDAGPDAKIDPETVSSIFVSLLVCVACLHVAEN